MRDRLPVNWMQLFLMLSQDYQDISDKKNFKKKQHKIQSLMILCDLVVKFMQISSKRYTVNIHCSILAKVLSSDLRSPASYTPKQQIRLGSQLIK